MLPIKLRLFVDRTTQREPEFHRPLNRLLVGNRQRARQSETHRTRVNIRFRRMERVILASAEHLGVSFEFHMDLESDNGRVAEFRHLAGMTNR